MRAFIIRKFVAPLYIGMANGRFLQKKYSEAIALYEKACKLDPREKGNELTCSLLGRSYLGLGENKLAVEKLSKSYDLYKKATDYYDKKEFFATLKAYSIALKNVGEYSKAEEIIKEVLKSYCASSAYEKV